MTEEFGPIPDQGAIRRMKGARSLPIMHESDENAEPAVDLRAEGIAGENYYHREDNPPYWHRAPGSIAELYVRSGVAKKLKEVNARANISGLELYVFDAYRPVEVQTYFHDVWVPDHLRKRFPDWDEGRIATTVGNYWSGGYPTKHDVDLDSPPPHSTGAVVDLTLRNLRTKEHLYMGSIFDEVSPAAFADHFEHEAAHRTLSMSEEVALQNRRTLFHMMSDAGFIVNPNEWWHFGYQDQMSAFHSGQVVARYSLMWLPNEHDQR